MCFVLRYNFQLPFLRLSLLLLLAIYILPHAPQRIWSRCLAYATSKKQSIVLTEIAISVICSKIQFGCISKVTLVSWIIHHPSPIEFINPPLFMLCHFYWNLSCSCCSNIKIHCQCDAWNVFNHIPMDIWLKPRNSYLVMKCLVFIQSTHFLPYLPLFILGFRLMMVIRFLLPK